MNHANESEFESIFTFLHYLRENYPQTEVFLPPLSSETVQQWKNVYSSSVTLLKKDSSYEIEPEWMFPEKLSLSHPEIAKVKFLSTSLKTIFLTDTTLIQICLRIVPDDIFIVDSSTVSQQLSVINEEVFIPRSEQISPQIDITEKHSYSSEESELDLDAYEMEVKQEREFIRHLHVSSVYYPPLSDNYRPKLASQKPLTGIKQSPSKLDAATSLNDKLKQELASISERLIKLRPIEMPIKISASVQSSRQSSYRSQETTESSIKSSSSSRKLKHESKARLKREHKKKEQQISSSDISLKEEPEMPNILSSHSSDTKRHRDYLQDRTIIPEPMLPKMEKLNLQQLSPPIQKKEDRTWEQIDIYSPSVNESDVPSNINNNIFVNNNPYYNERQMPTSATPLKPGYPEWLRLIPPKDDDSGRPNTATSRLLDIEHATKIGTIFF